MRTAVPALTRLSGQSSGCLQAFATQRANELFTKRRLEGLRLSCKKEVQTADCRLGRNTMGVASSVGRRRNALRTSACALADRSRNRQSAIGSNRKSAI